MVKGRQKQKYRPEIFESCAIASATEHWQTADASKLVFDGHGGIDAASFTRKNILKFILEDSHFSAGVKRALRNAFMKADYALADAKYLDRSSGTTALTALVLGR
ncbi:Protein-serine/threonine phosphatase [Forsythia ovata]|uniref:Protein-serine/threonine phosphatase n=1 Tax=Forsythia ovata TaxID=205694 RepID=A0ABD1WNF9_9LAMI